MPWSGDTPPFGFSANPQTWLPMPAEWSALTVERQLADPDSTLAFFRTILRLRHSRLHFTEFDVEWVQLRDDALAFLSGGVLCVLNAGRTALPLPPGELLTVSAPLLGDALPPDSAAWIVTG
jgi:alpha-glucosidase